MKGAPSESEGTLFVVATPIGNLSDITLRAVETLRTVDRVVAEDTRRTRGLLSHLGIGGKPVDLLDANAGERETMRVVERLLAGETIALVTDAGMPSVSDPGTDLVSRAVAAGVLVVPVPGPSAVTAAVAASGLVTGGFRFLGFFPRGGSSRTEALALAATTPEAVVFFEAPGRVRDTLVELAALVPERRAAVLREMTKVHEEAVRGTLTALAADERTWIGECTVVLAPRAPEDAVLASDEDVDTRIDRELAAGAHAKTVAERVAAWSGRPKREVYARVVERKRHGRALSE